MKRNISLNEISDGKLYEADDLVEASCNGCKGQASCCHGMGNSIVLDPYDIHRLITGLNTTFSALLGNKIELSVIDGIILPNLKMVGASESCAFLNSDGKCTIHNSRPGICRIFPLGRYYEKHSFKYILQVNECVNASRSMTKISKWIDTQDIKKNEQFLIDWHYFLNDIEDIVTHTQYEHLIKNLNMFLLNGFYVKEYEADREFYAQFYDRLEKVKAALKL